MERKKGKGGTKTLVPWTTIDISEEEVCKNWRVHNVHKFTTKKSTFYYCVAGRKKCPAKIKKEEYNNGKTEYQSNGEIHAYHSELSGLTKEQKEFVMKAPVQRPDDILKLFKLEGVEPPPKNKLKNFLLTWRKTMKETSTTQLPKTNNRKIRKLRVRNIKKERESSPEPPDLDDVLDDFEDTNYESMETGFVPEPELSSRLPEITNELTKSLENDIVSLKWDSQLDHIKKALFKMYDDAIGGHSLTDVTLVSSDGEMIEAHHLVLSMSSPYFQRLLKKVRDSKKAVGNTIVIILDNVKISHLKNVIRFIYTGQVDVSASDLDELSRLGELFEINELSRNRIQKPLSLRTINPLPSNHSREKESTFTPYIDNNEDKECFNDTEVNDFDESHSGISGDKDGYFSETDIKVESYQSNMEEVEQDKGEMMSGGGKVSDGFSVKIQRSTETDGSAKTEIEKSGEKVDELRLNPKTGLLETAPVRKRGNWKEIEPPSKEYLKDNWYVYNKGKRGDHMFFISYYCRHGGQKLCPARLKMEIFVGKKTFYANDKDHANHRTEARGLTERQKKFIEKQLEMNVRQPSVILKAMEKDGTIQVPNRRQIHNYVMWQKRNYEKVTGLYLLKDKRKKGRPPKIVDSSLSVRTRR